MTDSRQVRSAVALSRPPAILPIPGRASLPSHLPRTPAALSRPSSPSHPHSPTLCARHLARPLHLTDPPSTLYSRRLVSPSRPPCTPAASRVFRVSVHLVFLPPRLSALPTSCTRRLVRPRAAVSSSPSSLSSIFVLYSARMVLVGRYFFCTCCNCCITYATNELSSSAKM